jgi:hypothetical protein
MSLPASASQRNVNDNVPDFAPQRVVRPDTEREVISCGFLFRPGDAKSQDLAIRFLLANINSKDLTLICFDPDMFADMFADPDMFDPDMF